MWTVILLTCVLTYVIYYCCFRPYNYWKNRGITYEVPLPVAGNFGDTIFKRKHVSEVYDHLYRKYSNERYVGIYIFMKPALLVRDLDLIKKICVDDFDHFCDRVKIFDKKIDALTGNNLISLKGKEWKDTRCTLNSIFSDSHIESLFDSIYECAEIFTNYFVKENKNLLKIQLNDAFSRYDCDVISRVCFGVNSNSLEDKDNDYFHAYNKLKHFGVFERLKLSLIQLCPFLAKILQTKVFPTSKTDLYKKMVVETLRNSETGSKSGDDFLKYITDAGKGTPKCSRGKLKREKSVGFVNYDDAESEIKNHAESIKVEWSEDEMTAHILMFLNSHNGREAFLLASCFLAYELALNPSVQVKLQEEIDNVQNSDEDVTYDAISKMKYFDCVVSESLRKWPPLYQTDRECVKNFFEVELSLPDDEKIVIEKNTAVIIPIMAIHRDPRYFPQPDKFSPERFGEENRSKIVPGSFIPFGRGPRKCIGSKLVLVEIKLLFFHLLSKFDLVPTENTKIRVEVGPSQFDVNGAVNTYLGLKPRMVTSL